MTSNRKRAAWAGMVLGAGTAWAATAQAQTAPATAAPATPAAPSSAAATPAAAAAAPPSVTLLAPGMSAPLAFPSVPYSVDVGPLGKWYVDAALTGIGFAESHAVPGDRSTLLDLSNGQIFIQKVDGWWQFYVQAGAYSIPAIGTAYTPNDVSHTWHNYYDPLPQAFLKLVPTDWFSIEAGKLPTLIGAESTFTFENMNIERGLLWNQEPAVSRGVQATFTKGPLALNISLNDGYYSNRFNWVSGSLIWTINSSNTLTLDGGGNLGTTKYQETPYATPLAQNNGSIYNIIYTYSSAPWTITPYLQYTNVPKNAALGFTKDANSYGAAVLATYAFNSTFSLGARGEYIATDGSAAAGAANLLYGAGSKAFSVTVTPTLTLGKYFVRADVSVVDAFSITPGDAFGGEGTSKTQFRGLLEGGVLF